MKERGRKEIKKEERKKKKKITPTSSGSQCQEGPSARMQNEGMNKLTEGLRLLLIVCNRPGFFRVINSELGSQFLRQLKEAL